MLNYSHQWILPIERWGYLRNMGTYAIKNEAHHRGTEMFIKDIKKNHPETYSEEWLRQQWEELEISFPKQYLVKGKNVCGRGYGKYCSYHPFLNAGILSGTREPPICCMSRFEQFAPDHFTLELQFGKEGRLLAASYKKQVPGEPIYTRAGEVYDSDLTEYDKKSLEEKARTNIPVFFGVIEPGNMKAVEDFTEQWWKVWNDTKTDIEETAHAVDELLQFPVFFPAISEPDMKCKRAGDILQIYEYGI